ncbi:MAG: hypothetical protein WC389_14990 [Lutibacter sp.]
MQLVKLDLISKNNIKNGFYLYIPIVKIENCFYWCESLKVKTVLKPQDVSIKDLKITRIIPKEFYKANELN